MLNYIVTLAICSIHRPSDINTNNIGGVSKNVIGLECLAGVSVMAINTTMTEYTYDMVVATDTRTSMLVVEWRIAFQAAIWKCQPPIN